MKTRRVGTLTAGVTLVAFGIRFLLHTLSPGLIEPRQAMGFWPVLLILLGAEMLAAALADPKKVAVQYDFLSVVIALFCLFGGFACEFVRLWMAKM
ncbi:MAG: DUF5668 domain-containing protein [Oscillospiraceae bacterium]|nr:DUF5668 domain-containing protein [Oscillospiraceae bacterium]